MDPVRNPFSPGAGTPPPELVGRERVREEVRVAIERARQGRSSRSALLLGLRGVGKTVLLDRMREDAEASGIHSLRVEAPEERSLPALLSGELRRALLRLSRIDRASELAKRGLRALSGFVGAFKLKYDDIEVAIDLEPEPGLADNGDLEFDLQALFVVVGEAAAAADTVVALFVDELQYVAEDELAALVTAMHRIAQRQLPVVLIGAGLPQLRGNLGKAKSYAERSFSFHEIGPLSDTDAAQAIRGPAEKEGVAFEEAALASIVSSTLGYPYFLQEWGKHAWDAASTSPITLQDVELGSTTALAALDTSFFSVRFDRLTPLERRYLRAMAELGEGPHRSGAIADMLGRTVQSLAPTRAKLVWKGMVFSPGHGDTAFTVPLFDAFMRRMMRGDDWKVA